MRLSNCIECGKETAVTHPILDVSVCYRCWELHDRYTMITKLQAMKEYCLNESELYALQFVEEKNPYYSLSSPLHTFLKSQVETLALTIWGGLDQLYAERIRRENLRKKLRERTIRKKQKKVDALNAALASPDLLSKDDDVLTPIESKAKFILKLQQLIDSES